MWIVRKRDAKAGEGKVYLSPEALTRLDYLMSSDFVDRRLARRFADRNEAVRIIFRAARAPIPSLATETDELVIRRLVPKLPIDAQELATEILDAVGFVVLSQAVIDLVGSGDFKAKMAQATEERVQKLASLLTQYRRSFAGVRGPPGLPGLRGPSGSYDMEGEP